jgi:hypothetical protein
MATKMPQVADCTVRDCAYNMNKACHAMAITIGEAASPVCDTYFQASEHGGVKDLTAGVGACKMSQCQHNDNFECSAKSIHVAYKGREPDCLTFETR